ncbi:MAG: glutamine-hydrolyzing carbamoyl-phosphate synthase small subunit [Planctomycetota bacterium]|nr:glutamine-hydrolyzing carbamoyl-phosphate synthase small subunit [Planctomycetota bacterium]
MRSLESVPATLVLSDGTVLKGSSFGATGQSAVRTGEVVFNTAMCGYQEALTDPSYRGQILVLTSTQIGNYGVAEEDIESAVPTVAGFVVKEVCRRYSNYRAFDSLSSWLKKHGVVALEGVDTRAIVRQLRLNGSENGVICADPSRTSGELLNLLQNAPSMSGLNLASQVSPTECGTSTEDLGEWTPRDGSTLRVAKRRLRIVAIDCGAKRNIYRNLASRNCEVVFVPVDATAKQIRDLRPDGLFVSNGPGDPAAVTSAIATLRELVHELPTFGICLGHQLLALALGAKTWKLKFGHRGSNQPVRNVVTGQVEITSQNHGFCVDPESLEAVGGEVTHVHLNDGTCAGFRLINRPVFSVQYHPEASPGPHDSDYLFDCFVAMIESGVPLDDATMIACQSHPAALASAAGAELR